MKIPEIIQKMTEYSQGNLHDISHFMLVWAYAKAIGEAEGLDEERQFILETAAIIHDIACPLCREKYGSTNGKMQEKEGVLLAEEFLKDTDLPKSQIDRIVYLVGHHHTFTGVEGSDYQILLEADYIVNAAESAYPAESVQTAAEKIFKTASGLELLKTIYNIKK